MRNEKDSRSQEVINELLGQKRCLSVIGSNVKIVDDEWTLYLLFKPLEHLKNKSMYLQKK